MNIAFVTVADLPEGGGNTSRLRMLAKTLLGMGHRVVIWNEHALGIASPDVLRAEGKVDGVPFEYVLGTTARSRGFGVIGGKLRAVREISRRLRAARQRGELDLLWFNNLTFYDTWWLTRQAARLGIDTIQSYEDERHEVVSQQNRSLSRRLFALNSRLGDSYCPRLAGAVIVISQYLQKKYEALSGAPEKVCLVPTIIDCAAWRCPPETATDWPAIFYAGVLGEQDDMEGLVAALGLLKGRACKFRAVLLGDNRHDAGRLPRLRQQVKDLGLSDRVELPGFVSREEVRRRLAEANILINIRRGGAWGESGLSTKLSEYLASGRLVVAATVGDVGHYLKDGESAVLLPPGSSPETIARALEPCLASVEFRQKIGRGGLEVAKRHFDVPVAARLLETVLERARRSAA